MKNLEVMLSMDTLTSDESFTSTGSVDFTVHHHLEDSAGASPLNSYIKVRTNFMEDLGTVVDVCFFFIIRKGSRF